MRCNAASGPTSWYTVQRDISGLSRMTVSFHCRVSKNATRACVCVTPYVCVCAVLVCPRTRFVSPSGPLHPPPVGCLCLHSAAQKERTMAIMALRRLRASLHQCTPKYDDTTPTFLEKPSLLRLMDCTFIRLGLALPDPLYGVSYTMDRPLLVCILLGHGRRVGVGSLGRTLLEMRQCHFTLLLFS